MIFIFPHFGILFSLCFCENFEHTVHIPYTYRANHSGCHSIAKHYQLANGCNAVGNLFSFSSIICVPIFAENVGSAYCPMPTTQFVTQRSIRVSQKNKETVATFKTGFKIWVLVRRNMYYKLIFKH